LKLSNPVARWLLLIGLVIGLAFPGAALSASVSQPGPVVARLGHWRRCSNQHVRVGGKTPIELSVKQMPCSEAAKTLRVIGSSTHQFAACAASCQVLNYSCGSIHADPGEGIRCANGSKLFRFQSIPRLHEEQHSRHYRLQPSTTSAASAACVDISTEGQVERVNHEVENGQLNEIGWWGQDSISLRPVSRSGRLRLRLHLPQTSLARLASQRDCQVILEVSHARRARSCEPDAIQRRVVCQEHWFLTGSSERKISINQMIQLPRPTSPNKAVTVRVSIPNLWLPQDHYVLDARLGPTTEQRFTGK
jgi:hypothetical protein